MAGRKVFTSGEILTAADVNSFLMDQSVMVFADSTARSSAIPTPSEGMVTYVEDANRVEVFDGSSFGPIGGILQVVSTTKTDTFSASAGTLVDITGLNASLTPSSTSSKILVIFNVSVGGSSRDTRQRLRLLRDATPVGIGDSAGSRLRVTTGGNIAAESDARAVSEVTSLGMQFLDSPSSVSSLTYKVQIGSPGSSVFVNRPSSDPDDSSIALGRMVSTITLMEVAV